MTVRPMLKVSQGAQLLAEHGRFPSGGPVPFDVAASLIEVARNQALEEAAKVADDFARRNASAGFDFDADENRIVATAIRALGSQNDG